MYSYMLNFPSHCGFLIVIFYYFGCTCVVLCVVSSVLACWAHDFPCTYTTVHCVHVHSFLYIVYMYTPFCTLCTCTLLSVHCVHVHSFLYIVYMYTPFCTLLLSLLGWCMEASHTLPNDKREYVSPLVLGFWSIRSNFFCPGPHSCLAKCRLPIKAHASAWSCIWVYK